MLESQMNALVIRQRINNLLYGLYTKINFFYSFDWVNSDGYPELKEGEVYNSMMGEIWMDKNLGASQMAISSDDALAYGTIYQRGRLTDGHEDPTGVVQ